MALVAVLASCGGLPSRADADRLLTLGGYAPLTTDEHVAVFGELAPSDATTLDAHLGMGTLINAQHSQGYIQQASGPISQIFGAQHNVATAGGAYIERAAAVAIVLPSAPATPPAFTVPFSPNPLFVGRDAELERLYKLLRPDAPVALVPAIAGTGGIGKTQLAVEFAHQYRDRFPGGMFWLTMTDDASARTQVADYAGPRALNLPGWQAMSFEDRIAAVRAAWQQQDVRLLIFDNLEDPALLRWRPTSGGCRVLMTSRRQNWYRHSGVEVLSLDVLARADSLRLLLTPRYDGQAAHSEERAAADAICEELGDLPLALALAGAYLEATPSMSLDAYLERLRAASVDHPSLNVLLDEGLPTGHAPSILATFDLSYDRLDASQPTDALARRLLHGAAWCAPVAIPRRLLLRAAGLDPDDMDAQVEGDAALHRLAAVGLIEPLPDKALRLHRLLAAYARSRTDHPTGDCLAVEQALVVESELLDMDYPQATQPYLDHLHLAVSRAGSRSDSVVGRCAS